MRYYFIRLILYDIVIHHLQVSREDGQVKYRVDDFVQDAVSLKITPFMLDSYAQEYAEIVRKRDAVAIEMDALRTSNRNLSAQVCVCLLNLIEHFAHCNWSEMHWKQVWRN